MTFCEQMDKFSLASKYIETADIAVSGQGGSEKAWKVAWMLVQKFQLSEIEALPLFTEWSNRCLPPWSEKELIHKLHDAKNARNKYSPLPKKAVNDFNVLAEYVYTDPTGAVAFKKIRFATSTSPKNFLISPKGAAQKMPYLYKLPEVLRAINKEKMILLVEGEKDVETAISLGFVATTDPFGAKGWTDVSAAQLQNGHVVIIPDRDQTGYEAAINRCKTLFKYAKSVKIIELPGVEKDLTDWVLSTPENYNKHTQILEEIINQTEFFDLDVLDAYSINKLGRGLDDETQKPPGLVQEVPAEEQQDKPISFVDFKDEPIPETEWLIDGLLARYDLGVFAGKSKAGKSSSLLNMAICLSTGTNFVGRRCSNCNVLFVSLEDKDTTVKKRIKILADLLGVNPGRNLSFLLRDFFLRNNKKGFSTYDLIRNELLRNKKEAKECNPMLKYDVVLIDPLYYLGESINESDSKEMGNLIRSVRGLALEAETTMVVATHSRKGSVEDLEPEEATSGSGLVGRIAEMYISLAPHLENMKSIARFKLRDGKSPEPEVWSLVDNPLLVVDPDADPTAFKTSGKSCNRGRPQTVKDEDVLAIVQGGYNGSVFKKELIQELKEEGASKSVIYRMLDKLVKSHKLRYNSSLDTYSLYKIEQ